MVFWRKSIWKKKYIYIVQEEQHPITISRWLLVVQNNIRKPDLLARNVEHIDASIFAWIPSKFIVVPLLLMHALICFYIILECSIFRKIIFIHISPVEARHSKSLFDFFRPKNANNIRREREKIKILVLPHRVIVLIEVPNKPWVFHYYS